MQHIVQQVMEDFRRQDIRFPDWASLYAPVRSATTGEYFQPSAEGRPLLQLALESIFVDSVDWERSWGAIASTYVDKSHADTGATFRLIGLGPSSKSLFHSSMDRICESGVRLISQFADHVDQAEDDDIAIVGVSSNFPGGNGLDGFWKVIKEAHSCVGEASNVRKTANWQEILTAPKQIPPSRFQIQDYYEAEGVPSPRSRKMTSKHGNFLDDAFIFDPEYFRISPREAKSMDPQQRLLLHGAVEALDDAGYSPDGSDSFQRDSFGVYIGVATGDYVDNLRDQIDVYYSPGTLRAFLSGRISYAFGFKGPSMVVDTACSSSLVSIYHACNALKSGACTAALAGGVNVISSPDVG